MTQHQQLCQIGSTSHVNVITHDACEARPQSTHTIYSMQVENICNQKVYARLQGDGMSIMVLIYHKSENSPMIVYYFV